jgi:Raf kinase inhibitor-like YbhB/YbcL family protein
MTNDLQLTLKAPFAPAADIPTEFTCDSTDKSPALSWSVPPEGTRTLALVMDDPDAPGRTWVHWVIYDLPATTRELPAGVSADAQLPSGARQGRNDFKKIGYGGPCPPAGPAHRYFFKLYALDTALGLPPGATKQDVERAMYGHIVASGELMGKYRRH